MSLYGLVFPVHFLGPRLITFRISCSCFQIWMTYPPLFPTDLGQVVSEHAKIRNPNLCLRDCFKKADPYLVELKTSSSYSPCFEKSSWEWDTSLQVWWLTNAPGLYDTDWFSVTDAKYAKSLFQLYQVQTQFGSCTLWRATSFNSCRHSVRSTSINWNNQIYSRYDRSVHARKM